MRLSNSGINVLETCERMYYYDYVLKLQRDPNTEDSEKALRYGRIAHKMYEWFGLMDGQAATMQQCMANLAHHQEFKDYPEWDDEVMLGRLGATYYWLADWFFAQREKHGMRVLATEVRYENEYMVMIADSLLTWAATPYNWFMPDFKTTGVPFGGSNDLEPKAIGSDPQALIYAAVAEEFARIAGIPKHMAFGGAIGKVQVMKPKQKMTKADANWEALARRIYNNTPTSKAVRLIMAPPELCMPTDEFIENHAKQYHRARAIHLWNGDERSPDAPRRNMGMCGGKYGTPCGYWSNCHCGLLVGQDCGSVLSHEDDIGSVLAAMCSPL